MRLQPDDYHRQTLRPAVAVALSVPLLVMYEIGGLLSNLPQSRSGLEQLAAWGLGVPGLAPGLFALSAIGVLLGWHRHRRDHWQIDPRLFPLLILEGCLLGSIIFFLVQSLWTLLSGEPLATANLNGAGNFWANSPLISNRLPAEQVVARVSRCCGTSVFEEIWFRLLMFSGILWLCVTAGIRWRTNAATALANPPDWLTAQRTYSQQRVALPIALIVSSALFAAFHFEGLNPTGETLQSASFLCRWAVGLGFGILFVYRGLALAILAHAIYNGWSSFWI